ncbi:MAG: hypothetical protein Q7J11_00510 [Candidatus Roizmanbacteria bacterium]|nr:hypothetical protein [Candidatus Roizmanbacteria bacterium]
MITQIDILKIKEELKDTFATKDDLKESVEQLVELITDGFSRMDKAFKKISDHDGILNNFERHLDHLEDKVFA